MISSYTSRFFSAKTTTTSTSSYQISPPPSSLVHHCFHQISSSSSLPTRSTTIVLTASYYRPFHHNFPSYLFPFLSSGEFLRCRLLRQQSFSDNVLVLTISNHTGVQIITEYAILFC
ncbi:unnamed protein product [Lactuca virosa]|uniref:Uncharacterized protein n=1 Tax=Lactuca virosa TaxID=75947 RepID=A0AAU9N788_9ASTR|nr:unnamed protein product [Lactuca virosa]